MPLAMFSTTAHTLCLPPPLRIHRRPPATSRAVSSDVQAPTFESYLLSTHDATLQVVPCPHRQTHTHPASLQALERLDGSGKQFVRDRWQRGQADANAGYGITCVLEDGNLIEKACSPTLGQSPAHTHNTGCGQHHSRQWDPVPRARCCHERARPRGRCGWWAALCRCRHVARAASSAPTRSHPEGGRARVFGGRAVLVWGWV